MTEKELTTMIEAEEKRLGVGSREFLEAHNEIMRKADRLKKIQLHGFYELHNSENMQL